jgi:hypothetical protein
VAELPGEPATLGKFFALGLKIGYLNWLPIDSRASNHGAARGRNGAADWVRGNRPMMTNES